jgi:DNA repair protein RadA/Sms
MDWGSDVGFSLGTATGTRPPKLRTTYRCGACGSVQARWAGRCPACREWSSLEEETVARSNGRGARAGFPPAGVGGLGLGGAPPPVPLPLAEVAVEGFQVMPTGIAELDRTLAGGLVPGSATLVGGEPGTGKSTLLLQMLASMASGGRRCLLVSAEEAGHQVRRRAARIGADVPGVFVVEATQLPAVEAAVADLRPDVVVVDSVQAVSEPDLGPAPGSPSQVAACAHSLVATAKGSGAALVLVGHVTKDGALAGPRTLEHLVDTVLNFEGDRYLALRSLRAVKHRFGPTGETGLFEMGERGLSEVVDPSSLFLGDRVAGSAGSAVTVPVEGYRPVLVEVQALVGRSSAVPRRYVTGLDAGRVGFLVAVLHRRAGVPVGEGDVYVSVAGGARACEPVADLAVCLALASSVWGAPLPPGLVAIGEVGLGGELRRVAGTAKRLAEAGRLGFSEALVPAARSRCPEPQDEVPGLRALPASTLEEAIAIAFGEGPARADAGRR